MENGAKIEATDAVRGKPPLRPRSSPTPLPADWACTFKAGFDFSPRPLSMAYAIAPETALVGGLAPYGPL